MVPLTHNLIHLTQSMHCVIHGRVYGFLSYFVWITSEWLVLSECCYRHIWGLGLFCNYLVFLYLQVMHTPSQKITLHYPLYEVTLAAFLCGGAAGDVW